jgi:hypothetical protein
MLAGEPCDTDLGQVRKTGQELLTRAPRQHLADPCGTSERDLGLVSGQSVTWRVAELCMGKGRHQRAAVTRCCGSIAWSRRARSCAGIVAGGQQVDLPQQCLGCRCRRSPHRGAVRRPSPSRHGTRIPRRATPPRPDVFIRLLTSESGIPADPLTIVLRWGFAQCWGWRSNRYGELPGDRCWVPAAAWAVLSGRATAIAKTGDGPNTA